MKSLNRVVFSLSLIIVCVSGCKSIAPEPRVRLIDGCDESLASALSVSVEEPDLDDVLIAKAGEEVKLSLAFCNAFEYDIFLVTGPVPLVNIKSLQSLDSEGDSSLWIPELRSPSLVQEHLTLLSGTVKLQGERHVQPNGLADVKQTVVIPSDLQPGLFRTVLTISVGYYVRGEGLRHQDTVSKIVVIRVIQEAPRNWGQSTRKRSTINSDLI